MEEESGEKVTSLDEDTRGGRGQVWTDSGWEPRVFVDRLVQADKQKEESSQVRDGDSNTSPKAPEEGDRATSRLRRQRSLSQPVSPAPHTHSGRRRAGPDSAGHGPVFPQRSSQSRLRIPTTTTLAITASALGLALGPPACFIPAPRPCCCSVTKSSLTLCDPVNCSTPGFPVLHSLPEFAQTHVH